jgi:TM2 domain-containing membrane protein YozV
MEMRGTSTSQGFSADTLAFKVEYITDNSDYGRTLLALAVTLGIFVVMWALVRLARWMRKNARTQFEAQVGLGHIARFFQFLATAFAPAFFWFIWAMTLYYLCFFKLQTAVYCLLPATRPDFSDNEYIPLVAGLITVFLCYIARIVEAILYQGECMRLLASPLRRC